MHFTLKSVHTSVSFPLTDYLKQQNVWNLLSYAIGVSAQKLRSGSYVLDVPLQIVRRNSTLLISVSQNIPFTHRLYVLLEQHLIGG